MKNGIQIIILVLWSFFLYGQKFDASTFYSDQNKQFLEHLVKIKIDSVRALHHCDALINDSILYYASNHHSRYMTRNSRLSHYESEKITKTPMDRVLYFGGKRYSVGENVIKTPYYSFLNSKRVLNESATYQGIADAMVDAWVDSPRHFENIITKEFQLTGVSIDIDTSKMVLYGCQKFGDVLYQYHFEESRELFPFSEYSPSEELLDFANEEIDLQNSYSWKLRDDKPGKCDRCHQIEGVDAGIQMTLENGRFKLRIENSNYVKQLIQNKKDGFAVEIVEFEDYMCGNPDYFELASRRNRKRLINGIVLEPKYRDDLFKGYRKRTLKKDLRFIDYLIGADSVRFFDRFSRYRLDKFDSKYFEIYLGRAPKDIKGYWNYNLVYIQDLQICKIGYFTNYCGELHEEYLETSFKYGTSNADYSFDIENRNIESTLVFEKSKYDLNKRDLRAFTDSLEEVSYVVDSLHIQAYSSIEGNSIINQALQVNRAQTMVDIISKTQGFTPKHQIQVETDWKHFYDTIEQIPQWAFLKDYDTTALQEIVNTKYAEDLEFILKEERKAIVQVFYSLPFVPKNLNHYIIKEQELLLRSLDTLESSDSLAIMMALDQYASFSQFVHQQIEQGLVAVSMLLRLKLPEFAHRNIRLLERYFMNAYQYPEYFTINDTEQEYLDTMIAQSMEFLSTEFLLNYSKASYDAIHTGKSSVLLLPILNKVLLYLDRQRVIKMDVQEQIDKLLLNINIYMLNHYFEHQVDGYSKEIRFSLYQVLRLYKRLKIYDFKHSLRLSKMAMYYKEVHFAIEILEDFMEYEEVRALVMSQGYQHNSFDTKNPFYEELIQAYDEMSREVWCNMFMSSCGIPFQVLDHKTLRDLFCEACLQENQFIQQLLDE